MAQAVTALYRNRFGAWVAISGTSLPIASTFLALWVENLAVSAFQCLGISLLCRRACTQQSTSIAASFPVISPFNFEDWTFGSKSPPPTPLMVSAARARTTAAKTL
ncbi:hypothetical protein D3C76_1379930 [compost metagenome]